MQFSIQLEMVCNASHVLVDIDGCLREKNANIIVGRRGGCRIDGVLGLL